MQIDRLLYAGEAGGSRGEAVAEGVTTMDLDVTTNEVRHSKAPASPRQTSDSNDEHLVERTTLPSMCKEVEMSSLNNRNTPPVPDGGRRERDDGLTAMV